MHADTCAHTIHATHICMAYYMAVVSQRNTNEQRKERKWNTSASLHVKSVIKELIISFLDEKS